MKSKFVHFFAGFLLIVASLPLCAQVVTKPVLTLDLAKKVASKASAEAAKNQWNVVIAIVDDGGNLIYLEKMDGTQIGSIEVAQAKATTALKFKRSTKVFEDAVAGGRNALLSMPGVVALEGGFPLMFEGVQIGAIGISGVKSNEDGIVAMAGATVLEHPQNR